MIGEKINGNVIIRPKYTLYSFRHFLQMARQIWWHGCVLMARLKELEAENRQLKKMYAEERLKAEIVKEALEKSGEAISTKRDGKTRGCHAQDFDPIDPQLERLGFWFVFCLFT